MLQSQVNFVDADLPTGPIVNVGQTIIFSYTLTTTGNDAISNIVVADAGGVLGTYFVC